jgi:hypothetical protein
MSLPYKSFPLGSSPQRIASHERVFSESKQSIEHPTSPQEISVIVKAHSALLTLPSLLSNSDEFGQLPQCLNNLTSFLDQNISQILEQEPAAQFPAILVEILSHDNPLTNHSAISCCASFLKYPSVDVPLMLNLGLFPHLVRLASRSDECTEHAVSALTSVLLHIGQSLEPLFIELIPFEGLLSYFDPHSPNLSIELVNLFNAICRVFQTALNYSMLFESIAVIFTNPMDENLVRSIAYLVKSAFIRDLTCIDVLLSSGLLALLGNHLMNKIVVIAIYHDFNIILKILREAYHKAKNANLEQPEKWKLRFEAVCQVVPVSAICRCITKSSHQRIGFEILTHLIQGDPNIIDEIEMSGVLNVAAHMLRDGVFGTKMASLEFYRRIVHLGTDEHLRRLTKLEIPTELVSALSWDDTKAVFLRHVLETIGEYIQKFVGSIESGLIRQKFLDAGIVPALELLKDSDVSEEIPPLCENLLQIVFGEDWVGFSDSYGGDEF